MVELSKRDPKNLHAKLLEVKVAKEKKLVRRPLTLKEVKNWIEQAKKTQKR